MASFRVHMVVTGLLCLAGAARGQDGTFTQIGSWSCTYPSVGHPPYGPNDRQGPGPYVCPRASFSKPFGATPDIVFIPGSVSVQVPPPPGFPGAVSFQGLTADGFVPVLFLNGGGRSGAPRGTATGQYIAVGPNGPVSVTVKPKYVVLTVVYAPPGTNGGKSTSLVSYGAGSTAGVTTSANRSFKQNYAVAVKGGAGFLGTGGSAEFGFSYGHTDGDDSSLDIKRSTTTTIERPGPAADGINHDEDVIYLWLNPTIDLSLTASSASWTFVDTETAAIQFLFVGALKDPSKMPPGVMRQLQQHGITAADFPDILQRDPFSGGAVVPDPQRFTPLNFTFPYEPPLTSTDPVLTTTYSLVNTSTSSAGSSVEDDYKVSLAITSEASYLDLVKGSMTNSASWEWSNKSSRSTSAGTIETASAKIGGPAFGYAGATAMEVYYDRIYRTFAFVPVDGEPVALAGTLLGSDGEPLGSKEVSLTQNGVVRRTFTDARGEYRFYGNVEGPAILEALGARQALPQSRPARRTNIRLAPTSPTP